MGLSPSYYLSDFFVSAVEWVTVGVAHPYPNPFDMANVCAKTDSVSCGRAGIADGHLFHEPLLH